MRGWRNPLAAGAAVAAWLATVGPVAAHHMMDGSTPQTAGQGLLSGLGHPIIGLDHLAFLVAIGIGAALLGARFGLLAAFVGSSLVGVAGHVARLDVPLVEPLVAASVIAAGALVLRSGLGRAAPAGLWLALTVIAGLLHGYAFGELIVGAPMPALVGYLVGLAGVGAALPVAVMAMTQRLASSARAPALLKAAGAGLGSIGAVLLAAAMIAG